MFAGLNTFTLIHVLITLVGIVSGFVIIFAMMNNRRANGLTLVYLIFTVATSVTGFFFPIHGVTPALILGVISLAVLLPTVLARYTFAMRRFWRPVYIVGAVLAQWFNCFVLVVQLFQKVPALHVLAPNGSGAAFGAAQGAVLLFFAIAGFLSLRRFRPR